MAERSDVERDRIQALRARLKVSKNPALKMELLVVMERLESVLLPFSPFERPNGTPGHFIDAPLKELRLGREPFPERA